MDCFLLDSSIFEIITIRLFHFVTILHFRLHHYFIEPRHQPRHQPRHESLTKGDIAAIGNVSRPADSIDRLTIHFLLSGSHWRLRVAARRLRDVRIGSSWLVCWGTEIAHRSNLGKMWSELYHGLDPDFPVHSPHFNEITNIAMKMEIRRMTGVDTFSVVNSQKVDGDPTEAAGVNLYRLEPLDSLISVLERRVAKRSCHQCGKNLPEEMRRFCAPCKDLGFDIVKCDRQCQNGHWK